jgi:hypothetical protein
VYDKQAAILNLGGVVAKSGKTVLGEDITG